MKRIILDTNFLLAVGQFHIDIFSEIRRIADFSYKIFVLEQTISEINNIIEKKKGKPEAKLALALIEDKKINIIREEGRYVDDILVRLADADTIIATQDKELKKRIKSKIITIKQKKYLAFENL